jgi:hypothetical protein
MLLASVVVVVNAASVVPPALNWTEGVPPLVTPTQPAACETL